MILLLGGTSETATVASALAKAGCEVLVSMATSNPLDIGNHPNIRHRQGRLDATAMADLICNEHITTLVDITHPYATEVRRQAKGVAEQSSIPYFTYVRSAAFSPEDGIILAPDHAAAAEAACGYNQPILLTVGSRHVGVYARAAAAKGLPLVARVLPHPESLAACHEAGLMDEHIITGRGPFSLGENLELIRRFNIGVLVTKDSGEAGGFQAKYDAARQAPCQLIVVGRSPELTENAFSRIEPFVASVLQSVTGDPHHE